jgi:hypothetical protein
MAGKLTAVLALVTVFLLKSAQSSPVPHGATGKELADVEVG